MSKMNLLSFSALLCLLLAGCDSNSNNNNGGGVEPPPDPPTATAVAREATESSDLLSGPLARSTTGDFVLENELLRVIIQKPGRNWFGTGTYGGNIIDAARKQADGTFLPDHLEEFITGLNIENTPNYIEVEITNPGADGEEAQICARGPDDLIEAQNPSSQAQGFGLPFPPSADDRDLPLEIETCYSLAANQPYITMTTTLSNTSGDDAPLWWVEWLTSSGEVQAFQAQVGFAEPLSTPVCPVESAVACDTGECDQCNYIAYTGHDGAAGVSYGFIHEVPGSTTFATARLHMLTLGASLIDVVSGVPPNFTVPADGELSLTRYFAIGDGSASSIADIRNQIDNIHTGELTGTVTSDGAPLTGASVSVFQTINPDTTPPTLFMAGNSSTDADGNYRMSLPPGNYEVQANAEGYLFASDEPAAVSVARDQAVEQNFALPEPGYLQVSVMAAQLDGSAGPGPAKLQVVGFDPTPSSASPGVFGDNDDPLTYGITLVEFIDRNGMSDKLTLEPGDYQVVVSRGARYSAYKENITVASGQTLDIQAVMAQVVATDGYVYSDFHVHSIDSWDAEASRRERVATYLAEGIDFFTPSDHSIRTDFTETLVEMDVTDLIGTAPSAEITTPDYGHFNSWPVTIDNNKLGGGNVDWGVEAPPGMDFPEYASYGLSPADIFTATLADPKDNIIQVNHIAGYFGELGLGIDTGQSPPQSTVDPALKRLDPALANGFDDGFQALEVWISTDGRNAIFRDFLGQNAGDWFNLINQGLVRTGVANSDTHTRRTTYLSARNQIASAFTDPGQLSSAAETLAAAVAAGKVVGSNSPFVTIEAAGRFGGEIRRANLSLEGSNTLSLNSIADVGVTVKIASAEWAQVDSVDFYVNNQPELTTEAGQAARYGVCPDFTVSRGDDGWSETEVVVDEDIPGASRTEIEVTLTLPDVTTDTWLVAIAHGTDGISSPMFPVVPEDLDPASNTSLEDLTDDNIDEEGVLAYAFTNPLFIDVNGDGWTPPGVANASCSPPEG